MCGIAGFIGNGGLESGKSMIHSIAYRGPDFQGADLHENVCLAHARLSIIDLSSEAHQPMYSSDKKIGIVFNGEIYNFKELKSMLQHTQQLIQFQTNSDTEVLLHLYKIYGKDMLQLIQGMFVFALYDFEKKELLIARDRMGKKPLYYSTCVDGTFVFASELKAVCAHPSIKKEINIEALNQYLTFDYVPAPNSIYKDIFKLMPGHYLLIRNGKVAEMDAYWKHNFQINHNIPFETAKNKLDDLLNQATAARLMSDVPLGVFLSGGLDSSTVAYYAQKNSTQKIKTFSIGFEDKSYDEQDYAAQVAAHLGTEHHLSILTPKKTVELIQEIFPNLDEPFADASIIPTYYLSKFTRQQVTVALGGDGSDELLAGYPTFISERYKSYFAALPKPLLQLLNRAANLLPASDKNISFDFKVKQFLRGFSSVNPHIHQLWLGSFLPGEKKQLLLPDVYNQLQDKPGLSIIDYHYNDLVPKDAFSKVLYFYYQTYLPDDILFKVDRASMYNSLEVRAPFLDTRVVEFLNSLPRHYKHKGNELKYILKKVMEDKLPHNIIYRPKKGFGIPLSDWIRKDLKSSITDVLLSKDDYFNPAAIQKLLDEHLSQKHNHRKLIWNLFVLKGYILNR